MEIREYKVHENNKSQKIVIYGLGHYALITAFCLNELGIPYYAYANQEGSVLPDVPIIGLKELAQLQDEEEIIILLALSSDELRTELECIEKYAIRTVYTIWSLWDEVDFLSSEYEQILKDIFSVRNFDFLLQEQILNPNGLFLRTLDATITERCSLKCKDCSNLMQYYECPKDMNIDEVIQSIDNLLEKVDRIWELRIIGGEPFMHKEMVKVVDAYVNEPKIRQIGIFSNATIFPDDNMREHLKHKKIHIQMSDYGKLSRQLETWVTWCKENHIHYTVIKTDKWQDCGNLEKHNYSEETLRELYSTCECRNLPTIISGRLYNCPYVANAANLGAMERDEIEKDSIDLSKELPSKNEIDKHLYERMYLEGCRYCNGRNYTRASIQPFVQTKKPLSYSKRIGIEKTVYDAEVKQSESNALVSVIIPVYNIASYIERGLKSVIQQTYRNLEIIVIDDGSTDGSIEICEKISSEDNRIVLLKSEHKGVVRARNKGIRQAKGQYTIFVDGDDWIEPSYIEKLISYMNECDMVISGYIREEKMEFNNWVAKSIMDRGQSKVQYIHVACDEGIYKDENMQFILKNMFLNFEHPIHPKLWARAFKTNLLKEVCEKVDSRIFLSEDRALTHIYTLYCSAIKVIGPLGYHYCIRENANENKRYHQASMLSNYEIYYQCLKDIFTGHAYEKQLLCDLDMEFTEFLRNNIAGYKLHERYQGPMGYYPYYGRLEGKRVVLYGAGNVGKAYRRHILQDRECTLVAWVDRNADIYRKEQLDVVGLEALQTEEYDFIIVAVAVEKTYLQIKENLLSMGIPEEKILWNKTKWGW